MRHNQRSHWSRHWAPVVEQLEDRLVLSASAPDISGLTTTPEASTYTLQLDPAGRNVDHWDISWGDGASESVAGSTTSLTHVYADGPAAYTITATAFEHTLLNLVQWTAASGGNNHYYGLTTAGPTDWHSAENEAAALGGHLVSITTSGEQAFVVSTFLSGANDRTVYWTGINDEAVEGTFVWSSGETVSFTSWGSGEPNNYNGNEDWGTVNWHYAHFVPGYVKGAWNDVPLFGSNLTANGPEPYVGIMEFNTLPGGQATTRILNVTVDNVAPTAAVSGPATGVRGQVLTFTVSANDVSTPDRAAGFTYKIDWNGDGVVDETQTGGSSLTVSHSFADAGNYVVRVTATDKNSGVSDVATTAVAVTIVALQPDPSSPGHTVLVVAGTSGSDVIVLDQHGRDRAVHVWVNGKDIGAFNPDRIVVYGYDGNDIIAVRGYCGPVEMHGGAGNDLLIAGPGNGVLFGDAGNDVLLGGRGQDILMGGDGNDLLIGGGGRDVLDGGSGADRLLGGLGHDVIFSDADDITGLHGLSNDWSARRGWGCRL